MLIKKGCNEIVDATKNECQKNIYEYLFLQLQKSYLISELRNLFDKNGLKHGEDIMSDFGLYFNLGWKHIIDLRGLDHILFVFALCIRYTFSDWKKVLILVTAFTIGHSITLAFSVLNIIHYSTKWIEFLIPVTIIITALNNLFIKKFTYKNKYPLIYFLALFFGLIHGLGFSNYLKSILGRGQTIVFQLLAFNIGLEMGQLIIVVAALVITLISITIFKINRREYILFFSGGIFSIAVQMALSRIPF